METKVRTLGTWPGGSMKRIILLCLLLPALAFGNFVCGDANGDGGVNIADAVFLVNNVFKDGPSPDPLCAGDSNGDDTVNIADAVYLINLIFRDGDPPVEPCCPEPSYEILFIGSSYFNYNDLPGMMEGLIDSRNKTADIHTAITNGLYLADHASMISTELKINERDWDFVVLQGVGSLTAYPDSFPTNHPVYPALETLRDKILLNCEATKIVFCMPWAFEDGMTWVEGWIDDYADMQIKIYDNTLIYADSLGLVVAPVGWAWNTVLEEQNYPLHYLHMDDWNHPSPKGSYLMACVIYSTIYKQSTAQIPYTAGLSLQEAWYFQLIASRTVLDNLELWNIE